MVLLPIRTPLLHADDDLTAILMEATDIRESDIVVISSKAIATCENAFVDLSHMDISERAQEEAIKTGLLPAFCEAVLRDTARMNGRVLGRCTGALLCLLQPTDSIHLVAANAGMDQSNVPANMALGWPHDPPASAQRLQRALGCAVIIIDSCCTPLRTGVSAYALACAGMEPIRDERGTPDLFGRPLSITRDALADQLASASALLMGNAAQSIPAVIVRDHGLPPSDFHGWVPTFSPQADLFRDVLHL